MRQFLTVYLYFTLGRCVSSVGPLVRFGLGLGMVGWAGIRGGMGGLTSIFWIKDPRTVYMI